MAKHALALGYFFLAIFCVFTGSQGILALFWGPLLLAAAAAALMGLAFLWSACFPQLLAARNLVVEARKVVREEWAQTGGQ